MIWTPFPFCVLPVSGLVSESGEVGGLVASAFVAVEVACSYVCWVFCEFGIGGQGDEVVGGPCFGLSVWDCVVDWLSADPAWGVGVLVALSAVWSDFFAPSSGCASVGVGWRVWGGPHGLVPLLFVVAPVVVGPPLCFGVGWFCWGWGVWAPGVSVPAAVCGPGGHSCSLASVARFVVYVNFVCRVSRSWRVWARLIFPLCSVRLPRRIQDRSVDLLIPSRWAVVSRSSSASAFARRSCVSCASPCGVYSLWQLGQV